MNFKLSDFDYQLPPELIASQPLARRSDSQLLVVNPPELADREFSDIIDYLQPGDLLVLNNTKVIKARLFGNKLSGGKVEVMLERVIDHNQILAHVRTSKSIKLGLIIELPGGAKAQVAERIDSIFRLTITTPEPIFEYLEQYGHLPLPPYMERQATVVDSDRYQTVYAACAGSVAAPTAGLHFSAELLKQIQAKGIEVAYVTLHVGSGTFKPVKHEDISQHKMHSEAYQISQEAVDKILATQKLGGKIIAVGTTSLRTLETVAERGLFAHTGETDIFITPGFRFKLVDKLITNFHLPKSTLLMLVSAFSGKDTIVQAYQHAIANRYRFFSYGDAMLLSKQEARDGQ
jgi:S-adenosylmethionine:tRNA ribosyltransferase-isomerase